MYFTDLLFADLAGAVDFLAGFDAIEVCVV
jgi:hypothetical protein